MPFNNDFGSVGLSYNTSSGSFGPTMSLGDHLALDLATGTVGVKVGDIVVGTSSPSMNSSSSSSDDDYRPSRARKTSRRGNVDAGASASPKAAAAPSLWARIKSWFA